METLVIAKRGNINEIYHHGSICVVNKNNEVIYSLGDINENIYLRSTSKFIQILPLIYYDIDKKYNITLEELAIMVSSHTGRAEHIKVIDNILKKTQIDESTYCIKACYPQNFENTKYMIQNNIQPKAKYHMCSGKHLGLMLIEKELGNTINDYYKKDSKATILSKEFISKVAQIDIDSIELGLDGCGVPVYAIPLYNSAIAFKNIAVPKFSDEKLNEAIIKLQQAVQLYPDLVRDKDLFCSYHNYDKNVIGKDGAHGFYAFGLKKEELGIAFKLFSGDMSMFKYVTKGIYNKINYDGSLLEPYLDYNFKNDNEQIVGEYLITF